ncbi:response regulator [Teredinibacter purpureus]|uniref:response regulator n=1 Tax=Teredinibacter purpureus TaxID=2731756 RepID=UPI0005F7913A|nr:response regulator [Teredinibacter purpureus]
MTDKYKEQYTSGEVAKLCGVTLRTVLNWIGKGLLKAYKLPGRRGDNRIRRPDLIAFMTSHGMPVPEEVGGGIRRALIVDDELAMAKSIQRILRGKGFSTEIANDGFSAGLAYGELQPSLMTLDLQMPQVDGFQVLNQLADKKCGKIIVISGLGKEDLQRTLTLGADAALQKPFENTCLEGLVDKWF